MNGRDPFPALVLRPAVPGDVAAVVETFRRLSVQSLYFRFSTLIPDPMPIVASHLALVDDRDHRALVVLDRDDVVAVAQWDRLRRRPDEAEIAVTVEDAWQHRGLGTALARALASDARRHGIGALTARVLSENRAALGLAKHQHPAAVALDGTETQFTFSLAS